MTNVNKVSKLFFVLILALGTLSLAAQSAEEIDSLNRLLKVELGFQGLGMVVPNVYLIIMNLRRFSDVQPANGTVVNL